MPRPPRNRALLLAAAGALLLSGCAHLRAHGGATAPRPLPDDLAAYYSYPAAPAQAMVTLIGTRHGVRESLVRFPLSAPQGFEPTEPVVEFEWFESSRPGRRPAILLNPILGGDYPLERGMCRFFARHGYHVALVHRKTLKVSPEHRIDRMELLLRQGVIRVRQVVDWIQARETVDPQRIGSFGLSMGGMVSTMAAAVEPRLRVHVIALAGGSLADILGSTHDTLLTKPMARYLARNRMDMATLERLLRQHVKTDPLLLAPYVDPSNLLMIIAWFDRTVGRENSLRLWRALRRPEAVFLPFGHYTSYLAIPYVERQALRFFNRRLASDGNRL